jgi:thiol:disulfide interchange protein DsbD
MELKMNEPQNRERLEKFLLVQLYQDNVPKIADRNEVDRLLATNRKLQEEWFGDVTLPSYAVVAPGGRQILATFKGLETEKGEFARFLDQGLAKWQELAAKEKLQSGRAVMASELSAPKIGSSSM